MRMKLYKVLSKFPFNFYIFKKSKYIWGYLEGKVTCNELLSVCSLDDLKALLDHLIKHGDNKFKEIIVNKPSLLRLPRYTYLWKEILLEYPEKVLEILENVDFINDAKIIKKSLENGVVALDLEIGLDGQSIEAGSMVFLNVDDDQLISLYFNKKILIY